jgi:hypothetical protein
MGIMIKALKIYLGCINYLYYYNKHMNRREFKMVFIATTLYSWTMEWVYVVPHTESKWAIFSLF